MLQRASAVCGCSCTAAMAVVAALLLAVGTSASHEPRFHLRPPKNWINDMNGPFRDPVTGTMHMYMQYNPYGATWGNMSWYHFTSRDYVTWEDHGVAIRNDKEYDEWGAYTGSMTLNANNVPVIMYTCTANVNQQRQCVAIPKDSDVLGEKAPRTLNSFVKIDKNPVLKEEDMPGLRDNENYRDPTNFWQDPENPDKWLVALAARIKNSNADIEDAGHVVVFSTEDPTFTSGFKYSHSLWHETDDYYHMVECPDFFEVGGKMYLKVSTMVSQQDLWIYGDYKKDANGNFVYEEDKTRTPTYMDYGRNYAAKHSDDPFLKRPVLFGWLVEEDTDENMVKRGWSGMMDLPRLMEYDDKAQKMKSFPMPQLEELRGEAVQNGVHYTLDGNAAKVVAANGGRFYELVVDFTVPPEYFDGKTQYAAGKAPAFGVDVLTSSDGTKRTRVAVAMPDVKDSGLGARNDQSGRKYKTVPNMDEKECEALCAKERRCVGWTAVAGESKEKSTCTVMSTWGSAVVANETSTTGRVNEAMLLLDRSKSATTGFSETWVGRAPLWDDKGRVQLRVFVDETSVQIFKDGGLESLSGRVYHEDSSLVGISVFASNMEKQVEAVVSLYPMRSVKAGADASASPAAVCGTVALLALLALAQLAL